jgi:M-phase inducer tyrosine phosphatase
MNGHVYPRIHYPELYILQGGYCQYFKDSGARCVPPAYVRMDDPAYLQDRREDLDGFRKQKFGRTRSYAYGELVTKGPAPATQASQPQRSTAPSGGSLSTVYAAANAARARRSASGENKAAILSTLDEVSIGPGAGMMSDEDCSFVSLDGVDQSPCPAPAPKSTTLGSGIGGAAFLAAKKKLISSGRTLQRAQTFAQCR